MRYIFQLIVLLVIGVLLASVLIPLSKTQWATEVRAHVQEMRAKKRAAMEKQKSENENVLNAVQTRVLEGNEQHLKQEQTNRVDSKNSSNSATSPKGQDQKKGPRAKAPNFSAQSWMECFHFIVLLGLPFLLVALLKGLVNKKRIV